MQDLLLDVRGVLTMGNRYKNRQVVGPRAKCVGIDMNRYVISDLEQVRYGMFLSHLILYYLEIG